MLKISNEIEPYLTYQVNINKLRIFCQLRVMKDDFLRICFNGNSYCIDAENICSLCNLNEKESLFHFLVRCPIYNCIRAQFLPEIYSFTTNINFEQLLLVANTLIKVNNLYYYVLNALKLRSFIINE